MNQWRIIKWKRVRFTN